MSSEWKTLPLEDCLEALIDYRGKTPEKTSFGIPLITAKIIKSGRIETPTEFIAKENYDSWMRRGIPQAGDVVLTVEAPLGEVAQLGPEKIALAQRVVTLRGKKGLLDSTYLLYLLQSEEIQEKLKARATGTTVLGIKQSELRKVELNIPPIDFQERAAALLKVIDERITLLRASNTTLEAIAQALFKSWFVDFDPVHAKQQGRAPEGMDAQTAALFPDSFEESELGMVPKGWRQSSLAEVTKLGTGFIQTGPFGSQLHASDYQDKGTPVVMPQDLEGRRISTTKIARVDRTHVERLQRHALQVGDVVFSRRGDVGRHAVATEREAGWLCGTGCLLVRPGSKWPAPAYISQALGLSSSVEWLKRHAVGATMPNLNTGILGDLPMLLPSHDVLEAFESMASSIEQSISSNDEKARLLSDLRDTLLPRLISGQLRLPEAQALVEEAVDA